jgi:hypothetical protein
MTHGWFKRGRDIHHLMESLRETEEYKYRCFPL